MCSVPIKFVSNRVYGVNNQAQIMEAEGGGSWPRVHNGYHTIVGWAPGGQYVSYNIICIMDIYYCYLTPGPNLS